nr:hypothetical protein [Tanacetum cinerariifolium]
MLGLWIAALSLFKGKYLLVMRIRTTVQIQIYNRIPTDLIRCQINVKTCLNYRRLSGFVEFLRELYIYVKDGFFMYIDNVQMLVSILREAKALKRVTIETLREIPSRTKESLIKYVGLMDCSIEFIQRQIPSRDED